MREGHILRNRDKLEDYRQSLISLERKQQRLLALQASVDSVSVTNPSGIAVQGGEHIDMLPIRLQIVEDVKSDIEVSQSSIDVRKEELNAILGVLSDKKPTEHFVLKSYYMWLVSFEDIAEQQ